MKKILLIKPSDVLKASLAAVSPKFSALTGEATTFATATKGVEALKLATTENFDMILADGLLEKTDANGLIAAVGSQMSRGKLWLVATPQNKKLLPLRTPMQRVLEAAKGFDPDFVFKCLNLLVNTQVTRDVDVHVMRGIIRGVVDVISKQTSLPLTPGKVNNEGSSDKKMTSEASAITTFYSEGLVGAMIINAPRTVLYSLARRLFQDRAETLKESLYQDLCCEILNQVLGIVRQHLAANGYTLSPAVNLAVSGARHSIVPWLEGKYFRFPFDLKDERFALTLFHAYRPVSMNELDVKPDAGRTILDVRILNSMRDVVVAILGKMIGVPVKAADWLQMQGTLPPSRCLALTSGAGRQGSYVMGFDVGAEGAAGLQSIAQGLPGSTPERSLPQMLMRASRLISSHFQQIVQEHGYFFQEVYQCDFTGEGDFSFSMRGGGFFARLPLTIGTSTVELVLGVDSRQQAAEFDAWACLGA